MILKKIKLPKSLTGLVIVLAGAGAAQVPFLQVLSPYLITSGLGMLGIGIGAKVRRGIKKEDMFQNEKVIVNKMKGKKNES